MLLLVGSFGFGLQQLPGWQHEAILCVSAGIGLAFSKPTRWTPHS
jgi:hypothetical protein